MLFGVIKASAICIQVPKNPFKIDLCNKKQEKIAFKMLHFNIFVESCGKND